MFSHFKILFSMKYIRSVITLTNYSFKNQYKGSYLGILWSLIQPIVYIAVMSLVFSIIMRFPVKDFILYLAPGITAWNFFIASIITGSSALIKRESLLKKIIINKTMFPISDVLLNLITYSLAFFCIVLLIFVLFSKSISASILLAPIAFIPTFLVSISGAIFFAYATPYFRDITHLLGVVFNVLFWTIPIAYPITIIPMDKRVFFDCNPFYIMIQPIQHLVYTGEFVNMKRFITSLVIAFLSIVIAYIAYLRLHKKVIYYL